MTAVEQASQQREVEISLDWPEIPYKGLNYYTAADAPLFSEREEEVDDCAALLGQYSTRMLLLHGRSGAGKSSFLRAGLVPRLQQSSPGFHFLQNAAGEPNLVRCTDDPLSQIEAALQTALENDPELKQVRSDCYKTAVAALAQQVSGRKPQQRILDALIALSPGLSKPLVVIVDQSEEVFTLGAGKGEQREGFFWLLEQVCLKSISVRVIVALRTEFYGQFCDAFRIEPRLTVTPLARAGLEQFMLHGFRDLHRLTRAILRPTSDEAYPPYKPPLNQYKFRYGPKVAEKIATDLLVHCGESSTLPVLQIVCTDLYETVVRARRRRVITLKDYSELGGVEGRVENYIDSAIKDRLAAAGFDAAGRDQHAITQWRSVLATLVARQEVGSVTTLIKAEGQLVDQAKKGGIQGDVAGALESLAEPKWRLLRRIDSAELKHPRYSLGHDAIAWAIFKWSEGRDEIRRHYQLAEEMAKRQKEIARRTAKRLILASSALLCALVLFLGLGAWDAIRLKETQIARLATFASADAGPRFRLRLLLLLAGESIGSGVWGAAVSLAPLHENLREVLKRAPVYGGAFEAVGTDADARRVALLARDGEVFVQDLITGERSSFAAVTAQDHSQKNAPPFSVIGFVDGVPSPVVYRNGLVHYRTVVDGPFVTQKITDLMTEEFKNSNSWTWLEIVDGSIRLGYWNQKDEKYRFLVLRPTRHSTGIRFDTPVQTLVVENEGQRILPAYSDNSNLYAFFGPEERKGFLHDVYVGRMGARAEKIGEVKLAPIGQSSGGTDEAYSRALAFSNDNSKIVVRGSADRMKVIPIGASEAWEIAIPASMQGFLRVQWLFTRPPLTTVELSDKWYFAWMRQDARLLVMQGQRGIPGGWGLEASPLFTGTDGATRLRLSADGQFITLIHQVGPQEVRYRSWNLKPEWRREIEAMSLEKMRKLACETAKIEGPTEQAPGGGTRASLSDEERSLWLDDNTPQPCPGT